MAEYKLTNQYGNAIYYAKTEQEKKELISRGFKECDMPKKPKSNSGGRKKAAQTNE